MADAATQSECEAEEPISGVKCERIEDHEGAHIWTGTTYDNGDTVIAWGWKSNG